MKPVRLFIWTLLIVLCAGYGSVGYAAENILKNSNFSDAQQQIPPSSWRIYGSMPGDNVSLVDAADPENRGLLINDSVSIPNGQEGEVGIMQTVPVVAGQAYRLTAQVKAPSTGSTAGSYLQMRFYPGVKMYQVELGERSSTHFEEVVVEGIAPADAQEVRVVLWTGARPTPQVIVREISLTPIYTPSEPAGNLLTNSSFVGAQYQIPPPGWRIYGQIPGPPITMVHPDDPELRSLLITDSVPVQSGQVGEIGIYQTVPATVGKTYRLTALVKATETGSTDGITLQLRFYPVGVSFNQAVNVTNTQEFVEVSVEGMAPEGATEVRSLIWTSAKKTPEIYVKQLLLTEIEKVIEMEQESGEDTLDYAPADGSIATTNPPSFIWAPVAGAVSYVLEYSTDPLFSAPTTTTVTDLDISIYTPPVILDNTTSWYWRVSAVDRNGNRSASSQVRAFTIASDAVQLPLPPLAEIRARLPQEHPRLFVTPETLPEWQERRTKELLYRTLWNTVNVNALTYRFDSLPAEPPHCRPGGVWDVNLWRQYTITTQAAEKMATLAFAYMMTGDQAMGEAARRWMLHIASWDPGPNGATSAAVNDESSMPILYQMSRAYTWAYDALTEADRQKIREVMRIRGNEAYKILKERPFEYRPYGSHAGRSLGFLGEAAIAFMGEIAEAEEWFDYVVRIFYAIYPAWGKDAGGWAEGHAYWTSYMNRVFWFVDAFDAATGLSLYDKAFFKNTGYFKLYTQPPYSNMGPFGDFADRGPTTSDGEVMAHLASVYQNPYFKWYADAKGAVMEMGVMRYIRANLHDRLSVKAQSPVDLPPSAYFSDIGWVVFHKQLGDAKDDIQFMFKSSPYGSYSHSFADQNTFTLEAFGEPLAISSGYRPWYGSTHHTQWTKTTQAHNGVLVNGRGQKPQSLAAKGRILSFVSGQSFDYTAGDARQAYEQSLLEKHIRHAVYLRPDLYVLFDDLKAPRESSYTWLLHAYHEMQVDAESNSISLDTGEARLVTHLWSDSALSYSQTDQFAVPLDEPMDTPTQWHLQATTQKQSKEAYFLAVLAPSRSSIVRQLDAASVAAGAGEGVRLQDERMSATVLFRRGEGMLTTPELQAEGTVAAWSRQTDGTQGLLLIGGTRWQSEQGWVLHASVAIDAEMTLTNDELRGSVIYPAVAGAQPFTVRLTLPGKKVQMVSSSQEIISWRQQGDTLLMQLTPGEHKLTVRY
ncbi:MAG TPA: DUF4962 domain-containing protein [Firmicutes bacterium]|nr:DUF4962 domain-containing protein [Bacillota bacterium]